MAQQSSRRTGRGSCLPILVGAGFNMACNKIIKHSRLCARIETYRRIASKNISAEHLLSAQRHLRPQTI